MTPLPLQSEDKEAMLDSIAAQKTPKRPNLIVIVCDDLGYGDLGCYGSALNQTPVIDNLATEGMQFTSYYSAASVCSPSRAS
ncbi:MAG: sulfatase-like hydrolase/transferase, partial [Caldilineales bacterium]|nr:sulfatase-like hydrolase/transferase [Caldilineales bacterium]